MITSSGSRLWTRLQIVDVPRTRIVCHGVQDIGTEAALGVHVLRASARRRRGRMHLGRPKSNFLMVGDLAIDWRRRKKIFLQVYFFSVDLNLSYFGFKFASTFDLKQLKHESLTGSILIIWLIALLVTS
jgi:hypothetical protein